MQKVNNPVPLFLDARGALLDGGRIFIGVADADPETSPVTVYWDRGLTQVALQPLRTLGGRIVNGGIPSQVFVNADDYSMRIRDADDAQVDYSPSVFDNADQYQPRDTDLTAIAALSTTPYGRALLTLADQAALKTATGIPDCLPLTGGVINGDIFRQGQGGHLFWHGGGMFGRVFGPLPTGSADPSGAPGDIVLYYD